MVAVIPLGTITSTQGTFRQTLGMVPFLAVLAAAPLALWWEGSKRLAAAWRRASYVGVALVLAAICYLNLSFYFGEFRDTQVARWTFGYELADASRYLDGLPGDPYVYFYSDRWPFDYETRRYLAPDLEGEDRSETFGTFSLTRDRNGEVVFLFLPPYQDRIDEVERLFAGGTRFESLASDGTVPFSAYVLPQTERLEEDLVDSEEPVFTPTSVGPAPGGGDRDVARRQDLEAIARALERYREENGSYPDTGGGIQTLCAYQDLDVGCALEEMLGPLPGDPLGDPTVNGYWYTSDGSRYTIYALRESGQSEECPEHPDHLSEFESLLCVRGQ
jgi:hypothetical protein